MAQTDFTVADLRWRFWGNVPIAAAADCWVWLGGRNGSGYPAISDGRKSLVGTRLMREYIDGKPVPSELVVCHSCDNPPCVNPAHLFVGTKRDNAQDMIIKGRRGDRAPLTSCRRGHPFTDDNTMIERSGTRRCRTCRARRNRRLI